MKWIKLIIISSTCTFKVYNFTFFAFYYNFYKGKIRNPQWSTWYRRWHHSYSQFEPSLHNFLISFLISIITSWVPLHKMCFGLRTILLEFLENLLIYYQYHTEFALFSLLAIASESDKLEKGCVGSINLITCSIWHCPPGLLWLSSGNVLGKSVVLGSVSRWFWRHRKMSSI